MSKNETPFHYVATHEEAEELIKKQDSFWVSDCGCRENRGNKCQRSRIDLCLMFRGDMEASGKNMHATSKDEVYGIMKEAGEKYLVARPFRNEKDRTITEGICFCCDECCEYFTKNDEVCDKGAYIELTDFDSCKACGTCVDVCYFRARRLNDELKVIGEKCYGCGLCADVCPERCIQMVTVNKVAAG